MNKDGQPVLYVLVTGSPAARGVGQLVELANADGWDVCVVASPDARKFIDVRGVARQTGWPVRSEYKEPDEPDLLPSPDAMIAAPVTCNSIAKWATGVSDTLPLGLLVEAYGLGIPIVAVPFSNSAHLAHPAIQRAIKSLRDEAGVYMLDKDHVPAPHPAGQGERTRDRFPWDAAWSLLRQIHSSPAAS